MLQDFFTLVMTRYIFYLVLCNTSKNLLYILITSKLKQKVKQLNTVAIDMSRQFLFVLNCIGINRLGEILRLLSTISLTLTLLLNIIQFS